MSWFCSRNWSLTRQKKKYSVFLFVFSIIYQALWNISLRDISNTGRLTIQFWKVIIKHRVWAIPTSSRWWEETTTQCASQKYRWGRIIGAESEQNHVMFWNPSMHLDKSKQQVTYQMKKKAREGGEEAWAQRFAVAWSIASDKRFHFHVIALG